MAFLKFNTPRLCRIICWVLAVVSASHSGCSDHSLEYTELKQINEKVTEAELKRYLKVIQLIPEGKMPTFPTVYAPAPVWSHIRSLPIEDLVNSEQINMSQLWDVQRISDQFGIRNRLLKKALLRRDMSKEQFISFTLAIGLAASRHQLRSDQKLEEMITKGNNAIHQMQLDKRPFSSLSLEERHRTLHEAMWIARVNRAEHLIQVPPENINLVRKNWDQLKTVLPPQFLKNPLDELTDTLEEHGIPFTVQEDGSDQLLEWTSTNAIIGTDAPDPKPAPVKIQ
ncbi:hypothetical protein [Gimesia maris]|uniref:hypothetical protein n=1 Tax=Gimesia maris TaxID=122 RepID=UPI0032EE3D31